MTENVTNNYTEPLTVPRFMVLRAALVMALGFVLGMGVSSMIYAKTITDLKVKVGVLTDDYNDLLDRQQELENQ